MLMRGRGLAGFNGVQRCLVWNVSSGVCLKRAEGGSLATIKREWLFCGRLDKLNGALDGSLNDKSMRWTWMKHTHQHVFTKRTLICSPPIRNLLTTHFLPVLSIKLGYFCLCHLVTQDIEEQAIISFTTAHNMASHTACKRTETQWCCFFFSQTQFYKKRRDFPHTY